MSGRFVMGLLKGVEEGLHFRAGFGIGEFAEACPHVVAEVVCLGGGGDDSRDRGVTQDVFEEELPPTSAIEFRSPFREFGSARCLEKSTAEVGAIDEDGHAPLGGKWENSFSGSAVAD